MASHDYDVIIIGSGAAGSIAASLACKAGLNVALVESDEIGGSCPNYSCVPTKSLLHATSIYQSAKHAGRFGIRGNTVGYNYPSMKAWKDLAVRRTGTYLAEDAFTKDGVSIIRGRAYFIDSHTISIGASRLTSRYFIIATGASSKIPPIPGLKSSGFLTYKEAMDLSRPPKAIAIVGGGSAGCEFAQLFGALGSKVYLIEKNKSLLNDLEPEVGELIEKQLSDVNSTQVLTKTSVTKTTKVGARHKLSLKRGDKTASITVDEILISAGGVGNTDIGLENAKVNYDNSLISTNDYMQTSISHIYAIGDCTNKTKLTHLAIHQAKIALHNIVNPKKLRKIKYNAVPKTTHTITGVASVGYTQKELESQRVPIKVALSPLSVVAQANIKDFSDGFIKIVAHAKSRKILGATVVCPTAEEVVQSLTLAVDLGLTAEELAEIIYPFPSWSEAIRTTCAKLTHK